MGTCVGFTERFVHPGDVDAVNDLVLLNMLKFALERADKNLPYKATAGLLPNRVSSVTLGGFPAHMHVWVKIVMVEMLLLMFVQMWGVIADIWNGLDMRRLLFTVIVSWFLIALSILIIRIGKSNFGDKHSWLMHKKLRHLRRQRWS